MEVAIAEITARTRAVCTHGSNIGGVEGKSQDPRRRVSFCSLCQHLLHQPAAHEASIRLPVMLIK